MSTTLPSSSTLAAGNPFGGVPLTGDGAPRSGLLASRSPPIREDSFARMLQEFDAEVQIPPPPASTQPVPNVPDEAPAPQAKQATAADEGPSDTQRQEARQAGKRSSSNTAAQAPVSKTAASAGTAPTAEAADSKVDEAAAAAATEEANKKAAPVATDAQADTERAAHKPKAEEPAPAVDPRMLALTTPAAPAEPKAKPEAEGSDTLATDPATANAPALATAQATRRADTDLPPVETDPAADDGSGTQPVRGSHYASTTQRQALADSKLAAAKAASEARGQSPLPAVPQPGGNGGGASSFLNALGDAKSAAITGGPRPVDSSHDALPGLASTAGTAERAGNLASPAAPAPIALAQPLHDPRFATEMAARLSLAAADGVQEAHLHLNPAEMGPVAVQIVVDGQLAQISFHAEQADTRGVLEQSLPELAAALREQGLTLSGGGVFQQTPQQQQAQQESDAGSAARASAFRPADSSLAAAAERAPTPMRTPRGVVDLYA